MFLASLICAPGDLPLWFRSRSLDPLDHRDVLLIAFIHTNSLYEFLAFSSVFVRDYKYA